MMHFIVISTVVRINTYSWGSNSNVTLGHEMSRQYPEKLKMLTHNSIRQVSIYSLCLLQYNTLYRIADFFTAKMFTPI